MTTNYPVDSTYHACCDGIGTHTAACGAGRLSDHSGKVHTMTNTTTPESPTQTWRDLVRRLTPEQVADLEEWERRGGDCTPDAYREWLVGEARDYIATNERDAELSARIHPPAGAKSVDGWNSIDKQTGRQCRPVRWATYAAGRLSVDIDGLQDETGAVDGPHLTVFGLEDGGALTITDARQLAVALVAAADEMERLTA
ncbi:MULTISPECIES: hypothetical protein [Mycobacterium]|uniref:Uncharacterized protein n=1 Tax=Mycobacterium kiyosense TaxID=2871094 RepID=A0A9P3Q4G7_9MYCO|nr:MULTISPECIES: hypothetical protein [Mycobacterium]BDB43314.1 hypothetical protein IWGMT90018_37600 [Mycobacterium kiyosense]BDE13514.1 hypothetical protein MKCMC460_23740 [Mycobacterium sp. 20KCMC460]GLB84148.1 hypothetical protein SRL2020028_34040 [Mycobacterium kiyosense]GLB88447.1 hypothetical protein SRL2020130_12640 [Mycobacterium kiyosense]GLB94628.1 hypothetical protein SRL2020226_14040 [Mycobacterium kiyosense]